MTNSTPLPSALPARPRYTTYHTRGTHAVDEGLAASTIARRPPPPAPHRPLSSGADGLPNHHTPALYSRRTAAARCTCAGVRTRQSCCSAAAAAAYAARGRAGTFSLHAVVFFLVVKFFLFIFCLPVIVLAITRATTPTTPCSYLGGSGGLPACDSASTRQSAPVSCVWTAVRES